MLSIFAFAAITIIKSNYLNDEEFNTMKRKGVFTYDYLDSKNHVNETQLPPISVFFFNKLTNDSCNVENYEHAQKVWKTFKFSILKDYLLLYPKADVLLLYDIFENSQQVRTIIYYLGPSQYYTTLGLSWDAMLKTTEMELEFSTDIDIYNLVLRGFRGAIVQ